MRAWATLRNVEIVNDYASRLRSLVSPVVKSLAFRLPEAASDSPITTPFLANLAA